MKKYLNGEYIEMTTEEIAEIERMMAESVPEPDEQDEPRYVTWDELADAIKNGVNDVE